VSGRKEARRKETRIVEESGLLERGSSRRATARLTKFTTRKLAMTMTLGGWAVMIVSVGSVLSLAAFCLYRVLTLPPVDVTEHLKGPLDIDTLDTLDAD